MESKARDIFREALAIHYLDGLAAGDEVDAWLRTHGGWFPDPQELYGDGTPLTQPADEGIDVVSNSPEIALREAEHTMDRLVQSLNHEEHHQTRMKALRWLDELGALEQARIEARRQARSRSPRRSPSLREENARLQTATRMQESIISDLERMLKNTEALLELQVSFTELWKECFVTSAGRGA